MEKKSATFVKQAAILAAAGILSRVLGFVLRIPLTNVLGDEGIGIYGDGYAVYNFFLVLSSAGLPAAISKMVSERAAKKRMDEAYKILTSSMKCSAVIGGVGALCLAFGARYFAVLINNERSEYTLLALAPTILIVALMAVFRGYFQGAQMMEPTAISQLIEQVFNVLFSVVLMYIFMGLANPSASGLRSDKTAMGAAGGQLGTGVGALAGLLFLAIFFSLFKGYVISGARADAAAARKAGEKPAKPSSELLKELFSVSIPIIAGTAVFSFSNLIDSAMVKGRLLSAGYSASTSIALYGIYSGKYVPLTTLPVSITAALATAILPSIAASAAVGNRKQVRQKTTSALRVAMFISIPAAIGLGALAKPIYGLIFRSAPDGYQLLTIGSLAVICLSLSQICAGILQGAGRIGVPVFAAVCGVLIKIPLNFILCAIPSINIYGAVISTIICYLVSGGINLVSVIKVTRANTNLNDILLKPIFASVVMGAAAYILCSLSSIYLGESMLATAFALILAMGGGIFIYFWIMLFIGGLTESDLQLFPAGKTLAKKLKKWL